LEYATPPGKNLHLWTVSATLSLPFTPWGLQRTGARIEEATIAVDRAKETLKNARNMVRSNINTLYVKAEALREQLSKYTSVIIPQSERALQASMIAYQTGKTDFLMLIDAYRTLVEISMEKLMLRMQFEQTIAELKREVGYAGVFDVQPIRN
jgi:outer membrane protein TolC